MLSASGRKRLAAATALLLLAGGALAFGQMTGTFAVFTADTENTAATAAGGWIPAPTGPSTGPSTSVTGGSNNQIALAWTSGASASQPDPNPVTGQELDIADGGSGSSASCGTYGETATYGANRTNANDNAAGPPISDWLCYRMISTSDGSWTSPAFDFPPIRLLVPTEVDFSGDGDGILESGESFVITFNQPVASGSVAVNSGICQPSRRIVILGYSGSCTSTASYSIGKITGLSAGGTGSTNASVSVSGDVVTVTAREAGPSIGDDGVLTAAESITASSGAPACSAAACRPDTTNDF